MDKCGISKLKNVEIPSSVKSIGKNSLDYVKLRKIIIPSSVQKINNKVFGRKLEKINLINDQREDGYVKIFNSSEDKKIVELCKVLLKTK